MGSFLVLFLSFYSFALAAMDCGEVVAQAPQVRAADVVRGMPRAHDKISEVLPEYDPSTEFLYQYFIDGHAVLYTGGLFQESSGVVKDDLTILREGVIVKVRVGEHYVNALSQAIRDERMKQCKNTFTCQQRLFYLLDTVGIRLVAGPRLLGSTTYRAMLEHGFVGKNGEQFPQQVFSLEHHLPNSVTGIHEKMKAYELGTEHGFLRGLRNHLGYSNEELQQDFAAVGFAELGGVFANVGHDPAIWANSTAQQRELGHLILRDLEAELLGRVSAHFGMDEGSLFYHAFRNDIPPEYLAVGKQWLREALQNALRKSIAPQ